MSFLNIFIFLILYKMKIEIRNAKSGEFAVPGQIMVDVYSCLEGFPRQDEQPEYYQMLANIANLTNNPKTEIFVAITPDGKVAVGVVYFSHS